MLMLVTYAFHEYAPGAYDDFFEAIEALPAKYHLYTGELIVKTNMKARQLAAELGRGLDEKDTIYVVEFDYDKFGGSITPQLDHFITKYRPRDVLGRKM